MKIASNLFTTTAMMLVGACAAPRVTSGHDAATTKAADSNVEVQLISPIAVAEVNFDREPFFNWSKHVVAQLEAFQPGDDTNRRVAVVATLSNTGEVRYAIGAIPALENDRRAQLLQGLTGLDAPRSRLVDFHILFTRCIGTCE